MVDYTGKNHKNQVFCKDFDKFSTFLTAKETKSGRKPEIRPEHQRFRVIFPV